MKRFILPPLFLLLSFSLFAQKKPAAPAMPDIAALQRMTPAQIEAYKKKMLNQYSRQAKTAANQYNLKIDESRLSDFEWQPPPKDVKRLALIPKNPPTLIQLADGLRQSKKNLESVTTKPVLDEVKRLTETQTPVQQHRTAIAVFMADKPVQALLISMQSTLASLDQPAAWNNLAAMFNMNGMEQAAVPILMNRLQQDPGNPLLLNNMGQAYLGLGDMVSAEHFLQRCLAVDPENPEANRSMGLIKFFQKQFDEGTKYFEKELEVAYRRSTVALLKKHGRPANLYKLRKRSGRIPGKNYFEEIELARFRIPAMPMTTDAVPVAQSGAATMLQSMAAELAFWSQVSLEDDPAARRAEGGRAPGVYSDLVEELLHGLHDAFPPENLAVLSDDDLEKLRLLTEDYYDRIGKMKCPEPPANATVPQLNAFAKACCEEKSKVTDAFMATYNSLVEGRVKTVQGRWKDYLNGLVNIVSLNPTYGNKKMVYAEVQAYFSFLLTAWNSARFEPKPTTGCDLVLTKAEVDSLIASARAVNLHCPKGLYLEVDLQVAKVKGDCDKYELEFGKDIIVNFEKNFTTGTATLSTGFSEKINKDGIIKGGAKLLGYISFDNNWSFADVGIKGKIEGGVKTETPMLQNVAVGTTWALGGEAGFSLGLESGFKSYAKGKGIFSEFETLEYSSKNASPTPPGTLKPFN